MTGTDLLQALQERHSIRNYTGEQVSMEQLNMILEAGLLSPSGRGRRPWELIVVRDKQKLIDLSSCRSGGAARMLVGADFAIAVVANAELSDTWIEDCSIAMSNMHVMASVLGVGSCWIQGRGREAMDENTTQEYVQKILQYPSGYELEAILSLGMPDEKKAAARIETLPFEKVHINKF